MNKLYKNEETPTLQINARIQLKRQNSNIFSLYKLVGSVPIIFLFYFNFVEDEIFFQIFK